MHRFLCGKMYLTSKGNRVQMTTCATTKMTAIHNDRRVFKIDLFKASSACLKVPDSLKSFILFTKLTQQKTKITLGITANNETLPCSSEYKVRVALGIPFTDRQHQNKGQKNNANHCPSFGDFLSVSRMWKIKTFLKSSDMSQMNFIFDLFVLVFAEDKIPLQSNGTHSKCTTITSHTIQVHNGNQGNLRKFQKEPKHTRKECQLRSNVERGQQNHQPIESDLRVLLLENPD